MAGRRESVAVLAFIAAVLYLAPLLLDAPLTDPDEGLHAAISQEMVERGDFIVPRFLGRPFLDKPILFFWAQAVSLSVFGMNTAAARLPGLLFALLGIASTAWLAAMLFDRATASLAALCYATMALPFLLAQAPVHDIALVPFTNAALGLLWRGGRDSACPERGRGGFGIRDSVLASLALGLATLTKGLEGLAIVGLGYGLFLLVTRAVTARVVMRGILVVTIAVLITLPWYLAMNAREPGYLHHYVVERHLLGFATQTQEHSGQPWWFYIPIVIGGGLPWIALIRPRRQPVQEVLLWTWLIGAFVLLSLSASKAVTYVLPAMPAVAILAARSGAAARRWRIVAPAACATYAFALVVFGPSLARSHSARDLADYFNTSDRLPATIYVFDQRVSFVYYLKPDVRRQLHPDRVRSVRVEDLAAIQPFPPDAAVTVPADIDGSRLSRVPLLAGASQHAAGRYLIVAP